MAVPVVYRKGNINAIASYDFTEILSGTGFQTFNLMTTTNVHDSGTFNYFCNENTIQSETEYEYGTSTTTSASYALTDTFNFDTSILNTPRIVQGSAFFTTSEFIGSSNSNPAYGYLDVSVVKLGTNGSTETVLGNATTREVNTGAVQWGIRTIATSMTLTKTKFMIGEKLRLKIKFYVKAAGGGASARLGFTHDPLNRDITALGIVAATNPTYAKAYVPFRINL
jgi:hypothetical protein